MEGLRAVRRSLVSASLALLLGSRVLATTYVVDASGGPGADFTDLPAAVAAAQPGDVLRVMPGSYSAFICDEGITILGYGGPTVAGEIAIVSLPPGRAAILAGIAPRSLVVTGCDGPVIVQQVASVDTVVIEASADVRMLDVSSSGFGQAPGSVGFRITASRVEIVQSDVKGVYAYDECLVEGGPGLHVTSSSRVHFALSDSTGGQGPDCYTQWTSAADGGPGVLVAESELIVAGGSQGRIRGGAAGYAGWWLKSCFFDGQGGAGMVAHGANVGYSRVEVSGAGWCMSPSINNTVCWCFTSADFQGDVFDHVTPRHATLALAGTPTPGHAVQLTLNGPAGSRATIWIGRQWILQSEPQVDIELVVERLRVIELGTIPTSGSITVPLEISGAYPPGTAFGVQGECRFESGLVRRANSIPIVVR